MSQNKNPIDETVEVETGDNEPSMAAAPEVISEQSSETKPDEASLADELEQARAEANDLKDKYLRAVAELENTRRRAEIDVSNAHKYALDKFASEVLVVRDSLELAMITAAKKEEGETETHPVLEKMLEGVELTLKQLDSVFEKFHLRIIDPQGERFDPERHQAMSMVESEDMEPNHVLHVVQKGCLLHDRLVRPAMVIISKKKNGETGQNA
ncbi:MAG: nucleotide exchange factor GrpE [Gammaproteobacteria bacterium]|nr:nucleotide exchange factor GrpE [Gammaproteobacteria bacterium]